MKIAVVGYGRMGKEIEAVLKQREHSFITVDPLAAGAQYKKMDEELIKDVDAVIDFTLPDTALENIDLYCMTGANAVIGTTGWYDHLAETEKKVNDSGCGLIWAANFSIGVNLFYRIVRNAAAVMNRVPDYDSCIHEFHHSGKADSPSGTARMLSEILLSSLDHKQEAVFESLMRRIEPHELHVSSTRSGSIPGTHSVMFDSAADTIELTHRARNRGGFASGAVLAAEFINGKKGMFGIDDLMDSLLS